MRYAPAHLLNRLDWKSDLHGAGHFGTLEIRSDVIELKATVEGSYHHLETRVKFIIFQGRFQCNSLRLSSLRRSTCMYNHDQSNHVQTKDIPHVSASYVHLLWLVRGWIELTKMRANFLRSLVNRCVACKRCQRELCKRICCETSVQLTTCVEKSPPPGIRSSLSSS